MTKMALSAEGSSTNFATENKTFRQCGDFGVSPSDTGAKESS